MTNLLYRASRASSPNSEIENYLEQASSELDRISSITKQVLAYHRESAQPVLTNSQDLLEGALAMFRTHILSNEITLLVQIRCSRSLSVHPGEIRQVFSNLIANALDAIESGRGQLCVKCFETYNYRTQSHGIRFVFSDSGTGIPDDVYPKIFDAFYTTKELKGSGVGLWLSSEVIGKHKGNIRVRTRTKGPYRGTLFDVFLPLPN